MFISWIYFVISYEFSSPLWQQELTSSHYEKALKLEEILFPNRTNNGSVISRFDFSLDSVYTQNSRGLVGYHPRPTTDIKCIICSKLDHCQALNSFLIQEKYYPKNVEGGSGTCGIIDELGKRVAHEVFGNGKTFRDSPLCRDIVMQYLCLFWGSDNLMYTNLCAWNESVKDPDPTKHILVPKPPCRSFCIQVADICANDPEFVLLCNNIMCPPTEDDCAPGLIIY